jgi:hypothetical protein
MHLVVINTIENLNLFNDTKVRISRPGFHWEGKNSLFLLSINKRVK